MDAPDQVTELAVVEHRFVERSEERWILLRVMELLATQLAGEAWEAVAAAAVTQGASAEHDE